MDPVLGTIAYICAALFTMMIIADERSRDEEISNTRFYVLLSILWPALWIYLILKFLIVFAPVLTRSRKWK